MNAPGRVREHLWPKLWGTCMPEGRRAVTSSRRYYSYNFLLLVALLPFQPSQLFTVDVNCKAVLLHFRRLWHFLCWGAVAAVVGDGMGSKCGNDCKSTGGFGCLCVCVCVQMGIFFFFLFYTPLTETPSLIVFFFSFLPFLASLN